MARDGDALWFVRGGDEAMIHKIDTTTWSIISSFPAPSHGEEVPNAKDSPGTASSSGMWI